MTDDITRELEALRKLKEQEKAKRESDEFTQGICALIALPFALYFGWQCMKFFSALDAIGNIVGTY